MIGSNGTKNTHRILIIDDEPPICDLLKHILQTFRPGDEVMAVMDGKAALAQLKQQQFDLVITDYHLPGMNGLDVATWVGERWSDTPVILISGKPPPRVREQVEALGLSGFLRKPFSPTQLVEMVELALTD